MLVKDIMTSGARSVTPETPLTEVVSLMCINRYSGLPVVEGSKLVGIVAEKDVLARLFPSLEELMGGMAAIDLDDMLGRYKEVVQLKVADVMVSDPIAVPPDMHALRAAAVMARHKFRRIPVADNGNLVGMLSVGDVHKAVFQANLVTSYITK